MNYKFICIEESVNPDKYRLTLDCKSDYIGDVVDNFVMFLRGCGFHEGAIKDYIKETLGGNEE
jgi:uncharacterized protein (DUF934 family)